MRLHRPSGRAYVAVGREQHYLGPWGSAESRRAYRDFIRRWEAEQKTPAKAARLGAPTVADVVTAFLAFAQQHYRRRDGTQTDELRAFRNVLTYLLHRHAERIADDITGRDLGELVEAWRAAGLTRRYINKSLGRLKRVFRWAASPSRELVSETTAARLSLVEGLSVGEAPDRPDVQPVPLRDLALTLRWLDAHRPMLAAMARVGYYCGARPGEVCRMQGGEVVRDRFRVGRQTIRIPEGLAVFLPSEHKNAKRGHTVYYTLGPRCLDVLGPWLKDGHLFALGGSRSHISEEHYASLIAEAAKAAGAGHWSPNRLRHNFATRWDQLAGIEATAAALRHKHASTTAIYIQRDLLKVGELAARLS
jgi:integrase